MQTLSTMGKNLVPKSQKINSASDLQKKEEKEERKSASVASVSKKISLDLLAHLSSQNVTLQLCLDYGFGEEKKNEN